MADPSQLYQVIGPDGTVTGATQGPEWLRQGETLGAPIDMSGKGTTASPAGLQAKPPPDAKPVAEATPTAVKPGTGLSLISPASAAEPPKAPNPTEFGLGAPVTDHPGGGSTASQLAAQPPTAQPPAPIDPKQFGLGQPVQPPPAPPPPTPGPGMQWKDVAGYPAAFVNALQRGILGGRTVDYTNAALGTPFRMAANWEGPGAAFQQGLDYSQQQNAKMSGAAPQWVSTTGDVAGALGQGAVIGPEFLGWKAGATALPKIIQGARYLGSNMGYGGLSSYLNYGDPETGAIIGGLIPAAHIIATPFVKAFNAVRQQVSPLWSQTAQQVNVGDRVSNLVGNTPIQPSPIPNAPLNLAQATNDAKISAYTDIAPDYAQKVAADVKQAQQQAVGKQIGQIGPTTTVAEASSRGTQAVRDIGDFVDQREGELWGHPALTDVQLPTTGIQNAAQGSLNTIGRTDPALLSLGMTDDIRKALDGIAGLGDHANLQNINSYLSQLKSMARSPPENNQRAGALAARLLNDLFPALDKTVESSGVSSKVRAAYDAARDFTKRAHEILGTKDMRTLFKTTPEGVLSEKGSTALDKFFNFQRGSGEGAKNFKDLQDFADEIKQAWVGKGDKFLQLSMARDELRDSVRGYIAGRLQDIAEGGTPGAWNKAKDFLDTNAPWMQKSGLFNKTQLDAADALTDYLDMLGRPGQLQTQTNSATFRRGLNDKTFAGQIINPLFVRLAAIGAAAGGGWYSGFEHGVELLGGGEMLARRINTVQATMREMMGKAMLDPEYAKWLMTKASDANRGLMPARIRNTFNFLRDTVSASWPHLQAPGRVVGPDASAGAPATAP